MVDPDDNEGSIWHHILFVQYPVHESVLIAAPLIGSTMLHRHKYSHSVVKVRGEDSPHYWFCAMGSLVEEHDRPTLHNVLLKTFIVYRQIHVFCSLHGLLVVCWCDIAILRDNRPRRDVCLAFFCVIPQQTADPLS